MEHGVERECSVGFVFFVNFAFEYQEKSYGLGFTLAQFVFILCVASRWSEREIRGMGSGGADKDEKGEGFGWALHRDW